MLTGDQEAGWGHLVRDNTGGKGGWRYDGSPMSGSRNDSGVVTGRCYVASEMPLFEESQPHLEA